MNVVALHTDFRIYWPARLNALSQALMERGDTLFIIEIAGSGSPYAFNKKQPKYDSDWHILFPDSKPEELSGKTIESPLFELLDKIRPDVIIAGAIAFPSGALAVKYGLKHNVKIITFDDAKINAVPRSGFVNYIKKSVYSGVDAMLYPAPEWTSTGKFWGFRTEQMFFGVDVVDNDFWNKHREIDNPYGNYFVAVGRQIPKKNFDRIIEAYALYVRSVGKDKAYKLLLIGDGPERNKIKEVIKIHDISDKIILLPFKSQEDLASIYQNAKSLIVNSNIEETWGLVINEAMACGCPVFASIQCGATSSLVKDGVNGYTFDCNDVAKLANYMRNFSNLKDAEILKMRQQSLRIIEKWGLSKFVDGSLDAIDFVIKKKKKEPSFIAKSIIRNWRGRYNPI